MSDLYTIERCAQMADVSVSTIKRDIVAGALVTTRIRGAVRIAPQDWEAYLQQCRSAKPQCSCGETFRSERYLKAHSQKTGHRA